MIIFCFKTRISWI